MTDGALEVEHRLRSIARRVLSDCEIGCSSCQIVEFNQDDLMGTYFASPSVL